MNCLRVNQLLSAYIDHELDGGEMLSIRDHLSSCEQCSREYGKLRSTKRILSSLSAKEPESQLVEKIRWSFKNSDLGEITSGSHAAAIHWNNWNLIPRWSICGWAIAIVLLLGLVWPRNIHINQESLEMDRDACIVQHSAYQSFQPLGGGISTDNASNEARIRFAELNR